MLNRFFNENFPKEYGDSRHILGEKLCNVIFLLVMSTVPCIWKKGSSWSNWSYNEVESPIETLQLNYMHKLWPVHEQT